MMRFETKAEIATRGAGASPAFVGDLVLTFGPRAEALPGRSRSRGWQPLSATSAWSLLVQPPDDGWRGHPLTLRSSDSVSAWLLGELYAGAPARLDPSLPASAARNLSGHFLLIAWDDTARQWHVWTDRFGTLHAYHAGGERRAALGTFSPAVADFASRRRLDWMGLTGFFGFGFFPEDRTYWEDVRILRPATHYILAETGEILERTRYWDWRHEPDPSLSYDESVREFGRILDEVVAGMAANGRIAIPISGGLDSRTVVAAITECRPRADLWSYSYGYSGDSPETAIAARVAEARDLPFDRFVVGTYLFDRLPHVLASVEGFQDVTQTRQAAVTDAIALHAESVIAAHWGDVWLDDMGLARAGRHDAAPEEVLRHALGKFEKEGSEWLLDRLCRPQLGEVGPRELLEELVRRELAEKEHIEDPDFRVKALKTDQWSFRWTLASLRAFQPGAYPRLPFYDIRMADFFCSLPSAFVAQRRIQRDYLTRYAPDLARITWQAYDTNLFHFPYFHSWLLPKRAAKKAWRTMRRKRAPERNWEVQFLGETGRRRLGDALLAKGRRLHELVSPRDVRELLDEFYADPFAGKKGYTLSLLLTFSAWLEEYA